MKGQGVFHDARLLSFRENHVSSSIRKIQMHPVTPRSQHGDYSTPPASPSSQGARDTNPGIPSGRCRPDLSRFANPNNKCLPYEDFCATGKVPENTVMQSAIASCCLKYGQAQVFAAFLKSGKVKSLDLSNTFLDTEGAQMLADVLKADTSLLRISLVDNDFGSEGFNLICGALEENATLLALDLGRNEASGTDYVEAIGKMIAKNRCLQILGLEFLKIDAERLPILARALEQNQALTELGLSFNAIGPDGACRLLKIAEKLPAMKTLDLSGNKLGPDGGKLAADILRTNSTFHHLDLASNELGPDGANAIVNAIRDGSPLRSLSLSYNGLDGANAKPIASLLQRNTALYSLNLSCNQLFVPGKAPVNEAIDAIVRALECNTNIIVLDLAGNHSVEQSIPSRPPFTWSWYQPQSEKDRDRIDDLLQRNRLFNALSEKDAQLASQFFPGRLLSLDEGRVLAGAMVMAAADMAAYRKTMVEIACCINVLASQT